MVILIVLSIHILHKVTLEESVLLAEGTDFVTVGCVEFDSLEELCQSISEMKWLMTQVCQ